MYDDTLDLTSSMRFNIWENPGNSRKRCDPEVPLRGDPRITFSDYGRGHDRRLKGKGTYRRNKSRKQIGAWRFLRMLKGASERIRDTTSNSDPRWGRIFSGLYAPRFPSWRFYRRQSIRKGRRTTGAESDVPQIQRVITTQMDPHVKSPPYNLNRT